MTTAHVYDTVILGGGPAGLTAALYAARAGLDVLILERLCAGGQMALTHRIDNYPGFPEGIEGISLGEAMKIHAERFGAVTKYDQITAAELLGSPKLLHGDEGDYPGKTVILATGAIPRRLGLAGEKNLLGRGLSYCAACDGMFYRGKQVAVVGGGNSAVSEALLLSKLARHVTLIHRGASLRTGKAEYEALLKAENVSTRWNNQVCALSYGDRLTGVRLKDTKIGEETAIACDGLFVSIGRIPATDLFQGQLELDSAGYIPADETTQTRIPGVYAIGDVRKKPLRQIVTATSDGAVAAVMAQRYLSAE